MAHMKFKLIIPMLRSGSDLQSVMKSLITFFIAIS